MERQRKKGYIFFTQLQCTCMALRNSKLSVDKLLQHNRTDGQLHDDRHVSSLYQAFTFALINSNGHVVTAQMKHILPKQSK